MNTVEHNKKYAVGMGAGLVATIVMSMMMLVKAKMGLMPELDPIQMLGNMTGGGRSVGWILHFAIGTVLWGLLYAAIFGEHIRGAWWRGAVFATGAWMLMMVVVMPMAGAGLFGLAMGIAAPVMTLMMHLVFGVVLGATYGALLKRQDREVTRHVGAH